IQGWLEAVATIDMNTTIDITKLTVPSSTRPMTAPQPAGSSDGGSNGRNIGRRGSNSLLGRGSGSSGGGGGEFSVMLLFHRDGEDGCVRERAAERSTQRE